MIAGFEFGCRGPLAVRQERVGPGAAAWRLLYASDLHLLRRRRHLVAQLDAIALHERLDVILLGGDLIDRSSGIAVLQAAVCALAGTAPVFAVAGNHDARSGVAAVRAAVSAGGGHWLHDRDAVLQQTGRRDLHLHARPRDRTDAQALRVLVGHHPSIGASAAANGYDLAFAGHLHGGQCVWWERGGRLYPGAWFSRWNGLRFRLGATTLLVSRGVADTLPVRFRCPREVICCHLDGGAA